MPLLGLAELLLGHTLDATMNRWEEMFLPAVLREEVQRAAGVAPVVLSTRVHPLPQGEPGRGLGLLGGVSAALALLGLGAGQRRSRALSLASSRAAGDRALSRRAAGLGDGRGVHAA